MNLTLLKCKCSVDVDLKNVNIFYFRIDGKKNSYRDMSKEKTEQSKLLHKYKQERKGALREIRRDKSFLGRVKLKQKIQR